MLSWFCYGVVLNDLSQYFSVKLSENMKASSFKKFHKVRADLVHGVSCYRSVSVKSLFCTVIFDLEIQRSNFNHGLISSILQCSVVFIWLFLCSMLDLKQ